ncbi:TetR/AcrR family transcriptional regulator [Chitinophaga nivalis]|uniref:TetR/AcrR family transcriptional regulator n=1 Tax=Chitinophaga nivalis TaxID=2991709 RepID=A0ABT3ILY8_9BACT|nr:TetR/AcrR family transcriptional regulator [Chitinophaga nivalis]MCW3465345.1 TetR/AcrR family transcriptional regulator [Chitinophaga nivalis]MCW3484963.1 TetR/AcrR family transcriptional regulator [Chitinophaga nivalis]
MSGTKDKIVSMADRLVRTKGFNAFSYKDISDPLAIKNAAIHYHFPAKADLGAGVIDMEIARFDANIEKWKKLPEDVQLQKLFDVFRKHSSAGNICLIGSLAADFETLTPAMRDKVHTMATRILVWMTDCLETGRKHKRLHFNGQAEDRALIIMSNLQSSLLLSRILGPATFRKIADQLLEDLR